MSKDLIAKVEATVDASVSEVWQALITPSAIKDYMFGAEVESDWTCGSKITWKGEFKGKPYEDKGEILAIEPGRLLKYSHFSPLGGKPDVPENYHNVTITLEPDGQNTQVRLTQDNNGDEKAVEESENNWKTMLEGLKKYVEGAEGDSAASVSA